VSSIYSYARVLWYSIFELDFIFILQDYVAHRFSLLSVKYLFCLSIIRRPAVPPYKAGSATLSTDRILSWIFTGLFTLL
jgi:hypothetical protein